MSGHMSRITAPLSIAAAVEAVVFALAFLAAPRSCEGGLTLYFWAGVASLILLIALPFLTSIGNSLLIRLAWGLGLSVFGAAVWFAGLFLANVRIMCRLF